MIKIDLPVWIEWDRCKFDALPGQIRFMESLPWDTGLTDKQRTAAENIIEQIHDFQDFASEAAGVYGDIS